MADLVQTAASVLAAASAAGNIRQVTAGGTITAGMPVYLDAATRTYKAADASALLTAAAVGIALNGAASGQPLTILTGGSINIGATLTVGAVYVVSATAGAIAPLADLLSTEYVTTLGTATSTSLLLLNINASGTQKP